MAVVKDSLSIVALVILTCSLIILVIWIIYFVSVSNATRHELICGSNKAFNVFTFFVFATIPLAHIIIKSSPSIRRTLKFTFGQIPNAWRRIIDSGSTPYFKSDIYKIKNGEYVKAQQYDIMSDSKGLPIVNEAAQLNSFDMIIYQRYYPDQFKHIVSYLLQVTNTKSEYSPAFDEWMSMLRKYLGVYVIGQTCMIVKPYQFDYLLIHKDQYKTFINDEESERIIVDEHNIQKRHDENTISKHSGLRWFFKHLFDSRPISEDDEHKYLAPNYEFYEQIFVEVWCLHKLMPHTLYHVYHAVIKMMKDNSNPLSINYIENTLISYVMRIMTLNKYHELKLTSIKFIESMPSSDEFDYYQSITTGEDAIITFSDIMNEYHKNTAVLSSIQYARSCITKNEFNNIKTMDAALNKTNPNVDPTFVRIKKIKKYISDDDLLKQIKIHNKATLPKKEYFKMITHRLSSLTPDTSTFSKINDSKFMNRIKLNSSITKSPQLSDSDPPPKQPSTSIFQKLFDIQKADPDFTNIYTQPSNSRTNQKVKNTWFDIPSVSMPSLSMPSLSMPSLSMPSLSMPSLSMPSLSLPSTKRVGVTTTSEFVAPISLTDKVNQLQTNFNQGSIQSFGRQSLHDTYQQQIDGQSNSTIADEVKKDNQQSIFTFGQYSSQDEKQLINTSTDETSNGVRQADNIISDRQDLDKSSDEQSRNDYQTKSILSPRINRRHSARQQLQRRLETIIEERTNKEMNNVKITGGSVSVLLSQTEAALSNCEKAIGSLDETKGHEQINHAYNQLKQKFTDALQTHENIMMTNAELEAQLNKSDTNKVDLLRQIELVKAQLKISNDELASNLQKTIRLLAFANRMATQKNLNVSLSKFAAIWKLKSKTNSESKQYVKQIGDLSQSMSDLNTRKIVTQIQNMGIREQLRKSKTEAEDLQREKANLKADIEQKQSEYNTRIRELESELSTADESRKQLFKMLIAKALAITEIERDVASEKANVITLKGTIDALENLLSEKRIELEQVRNEKNETQQSSQSPLESKNIKVKEERIQELEQQKQDYEKEKASLESQFRERIENYENKINHYNDERLRYESTIEELKRNNEQKALQLQDFETRRYNEMLKINSKHQAELQAQKVQAEEEVSKYKNQRDEINLKIGEMQEEIRQYQVKESLGITAASGIIAEKENEIKRLQRLNKNMTEKETDLSAQIRVTNEKLEKLNSEHEGLKKSFADSKTMIDTQASQIKNHIADIETKAKAIAELTSDLDYAERNLQETNEKYEASMKTTSDLKTKLDELTSKHNKLLDQHKKTITEYDERIAELNKNHNQSIDDLMKQLENTKRLREVEVKSQVEKGVECMSVIGNSTAKNYAIDAVKTSSNNFINDIAINQELIIKLNKIMNYISSKKGGEKRDELINKVLDLVWKKMHEMNSFHNRDAKAFVATNSFKLCIIMYSILQHVIPKHKKILQTLEQCVPNGKLDDTFIYSYESIGCVHKFILDATKFFDKESNTLVGYLSKTINSITYDTAMDTIKQYMFYPLSASEPQSRRSSKQSSSANQIEPPANENESPTPPANENELPAPNEEVNDLYEYTEREMKSSTKEDLSTQGSSTQGSSTQGSRIVAWS